MKRLNCLWCLLLIGVLAGCGAERDEPFDPGNGDDDEDPDRARITVSRILHDDQTLLDVDGDRQNLILRDEESYYLYFDRYSDALPATEPDFSTGQVVLIDLGAREDNNCDYRLELQSVYAEEYNEEAARLVVNLQAREAGSQADCPVEDPEFLRPFYFYYVDSRRPLIIAEIIDD